MTLSNLLAAAYTAHWQNRPLPDLSVIPRGELVAMRADLDAVKDRCHIARVKVGILDEALK